MKSEERDILEFGEKKIYNVVDVVANFESYLGMNFGDMKDLFLNSKVFSWNVISDYVQGYYKKMKMGSSLEEVLDNREKTYFYFCNNLEILRSKGLSYLMLLEYLATRKNDDDRIKSIEEMLRQFNIFHYSTILSGEHLNKLFIPLEYTLKNFNYFLRQANDLESYNKQVVDDFMLIFGQDKIYPQKELIITDGVRCDKTSYNLRKSLANNVRNY